MSVELARLKTESSQLSLEERASLVEHLIRGLDEESPTPQEQAWAKELNRRVADLESGRVQPLAGDEVHQRIERLLQK